MALPTRRLLLLAAALLLAALQPAFAEWGQYTWGETFNSWWLYTPDSQPSSAGIKPQGMVASSVGNAVYVIASSAGGAPPGLAAGSWPADSGTHGALLLFSSAANAVASAAALAGNSASGDFVWGVALAPPAAGQAAGTDVLYVVGHTLGVIGTLPGSVSAGLADAFVAKLTINTTSYSTAPVVNWIAQFGSSANDRGNAVAVSADGSAIYVACVALSTGATGRDGFLVKLDASGAVQWTNRFTDATNSPNSASEDWPTKVAVGPSGAVYMASRTKGSSLVSGSSVANAKAGTFDWTLTKVSAAGTIVWHRQLSGNSPDGKAYQTTADDTVTGLYVNAAEEVCTAQRPLDDAAI